MNDDEIIAYFADSPLGVGTLGKSPETDNIWVKFPDTLRPDGTVLATSFAASDVDVPSVMSYRRNEAIVALAEMETVTNIGYRITDALRKFVEAASLAKISPSTHGVKEKAEAAHDKAVSVMADAIEAIKGANQ